MKKYLVVILMLCSVYNTYATHNRAGEITYEQIGPLTVRARLTTYTKTSSAAADRDSLEVNWGDGTKQWVVRSNDKGFPLLNDVKLNYYVAEHSYPGRGAYVISFEDPNRIGGILNINYPRSDEVKFFLSTRLTLLDQQFQGPNSSAILLQPPLDIGCVGKRFIHNPNAFDPDGDSLSFEFTVPLESEGQAVPNYVFPDKIFPGNGNKISLNPITGEFVWNAPPQPGEYNIAFLIKEWRNGVVINQIVRDMQILISNCSSNPPVIDAIDEICVIAGTELNIDIKISDPDINQLVSTAYTGGPLQAGAIKPSMTNSMQQLKPSYISRFNWKTTCDDIKKEAYQIVIRASDNSITDSFGLSTLKTIRIKVVGPPPRNLSSTILNENNIRVRWEAPYQCESDGSKAFVGFSVWRSEVPNNIVIDTCYYNGITAPYKRIVFNTKVKDNIGYFIDDKNLQDNVTYCYRVVAEFNNIPSSSISINRVQSLPSNEVCLVLKRDIPLIVKTDIISTSNTNGNVDIIWTKPLLADFDTSKFLSPYKTELLRKIGNDFELIPGSTKTFTSFSNWKDTLFTDVTNTILTRIEYKLNFYYESSKLYKPIPTSTSVFLKVSPMDKQNILTWTSMTPWINQTYFIYRKIEGGIFQLIDSVKSNTTYTNGNLSNDINYCYRIQSVGSYNIKDIVTPILNFSQEVCSKPRDINPPCPPSLIVETICDEEIIQGDLANKIIITDNTSCGSTEIPSSYNIYFKEKKEDKYALLSSSKNKSYTHKLDNNSISGCYQITSLDALQNESKPSADICIENCPLYLLPNTFTPNGDGANEVFKPIKNYFIKSIQFKLFNEWGNLVYETNDPEINWKGTYKNGDEAPTGTYYYTCNVFSESIENTVVASDRKGYINLLR